jgi:hypothetical protein
MNKNDITEAILNGLGLPHYEEDVKKHISLWWANPAKSSRSLQLTKEGFDVFNKVEIKFFKVSLPEETNLTMTGQFHLDLIRSMRCPFYISHRKRCIFVTDDKTAVQLILYGGNINQFVKIKAQTRKKALDNTK